MPPIWKVDGSARGGPGRFLPSPFSGRPDWGEGYLRSDNGSWFTAEAVKRVLKELGVETLFIEPGSPWENGYVESFNSQMRDELLNDELFLYIDDMKHVVGRWRMDYNHYRPHSSLSYATPAGFADLCREVSCVRPHTPVPDGVQDCGILS